MVTIYIVFFVAETDHSTLKLTSKPEPAKPKKKSKSNRKKPQKVEDAETSDSEKQIEIEPELRQTFSIFFDMATNKNTLTWFCFAAISGAASAIPNNIFEVYITNDLGMAKENLSLMRLLFTPLNIMLAFFSGYLTSKMPFRALRLAILFDMLLNAYGIFCIIGTFPEKDQITNATILNVSVFSLLMNLIQTFEMVSTFAFIMQITDKRISGIHVTFLACLTNLTSSVHKLYVFRLVDNFGIFYPQIALLIIGLAGWIILGRPFVALENKKRESWHVSSKTLEKRSQI